MDFGYVFWGGDMIDDIESPDKILHEFYEERRTNMERKEKALKQLSLEKVYEVREDRDYVEVFGGQGGDVECYRVYFDGDDEITMICIK